MELVSRFDTARRDKEGGSLKGYGGCRELIHSERLTEGLVDNEKEQMVKLLAWLRDALPKNRDISTLTGFCWEANERVQNCIKERDPEAPFASKHDGSKLK